MTNGTKEVMAPVWHKHSIHTSVEKERTPEVTDSRSNSPKQRIKDRISQRWRLWSATGAAVLLLLAGGGWAVASLIGDDSSTAGGTSPEVRAEKAAQQYEQSVFAYREGKMQQATELAHQSLEWNSKEKGYWLHLANLYGEQGQYEDGVRTLSEGVKQVPDPEMHHALAIHAYYAEDWEKAERAIVQALALKPDHPEYLYHQGKILGAKGDTTGAIRSIQFAIDQDRNNALYHHDRAIFLLKDGDLERAKSYAWRAAKLEPETPRYWVTTGNVYLADRERVQKDASLSPRERRLESLTLARHAINFYSRALELNPKNGRTHYRLSIAHVYNEDLDAALQSAEKAIELEPKRALHHYQRAVVLMKRGEREQARESLKKAQEINPDNRRYQEALDVLG